MARADGGGSGVPPRVTLDMAMSPMAQVNWSRLFCVILMIFAFIVAYFYPDLIWEG
ncbi:hypothetical protein M1N05_01875 [Dehalococcoidales bacterium]|nr:hypothetical protein [Dehalococcoidales bacterium]